MERFQKTILGRFRCKFCKEYVESGANNLLSHASYCQYPIPKGEGVNEGLNDGYIKSKKCFLCKELKPLSEYDEDRMKYQLAPDMKTCKVCKECDYNRAMESMQVIRYNFEGNTFDVITFADDQELNKFFNKN
jgi:ribosomal protein L24E